MKKLIYAMILLMSANALADVDDDTREALKWNKRAGEAPALLSDYMVGALATVPAIYSLMRFDDRSKMSNTAFSYGVSLGMVEVVKRFVGRTRPNGSNNRSFYSGHTANAFVGASLICAEFSKGMCGVALVMASSVGYLRIAADKHWLSDVLVGAAVGLATGHFVPVTVARF